MFSHTIFVQDTHLIPHACLKYQTSWIEPTHANLQQDQPILSMDVETIHGPRMDQEDKNDIMIRADTVQIKNEVESVKLNYCVKLRVDSLDEKQYKLEKAVRTFEDDVHNLNVERETLHLDMDALQ